MRTQSQRLSVLYMVWTPSEPRPLEPSVWTLMQTGTLKSRFSRIHCRKSAGIIALKLTRTHAQLSSIMGTREREIETIPWCTLSSWQICGSLHLQTPEKRQETMKAKSLWTNLPPASHWTSLCLPCIRTQMCRYCSPARPVAVSPSQSWGCSGPLFWWPRQSEPQLELLEEQQTQHNFLFIMLWMLTNAMLSLQRKCTLVYLFLIWQVNVTAHL